MAVLPDKASLIFNPSSAAPGFIVENVFCLPGVPSILKSMLGGLNDKIVGGKKILSKTINLRTVESEIADSLDLIGTIYRYMILVLTMMQLLDEKLHSRIKRNLQNPGSKKLRFWIFGSLQNGFGLSKNHRF